MIFKILEESRLQDKESDDDLIVHAQKLINEHKMFNRMQTIMEDDEDEMDDESLRSFAFRDEEGNRIDEDQIDSERVILQYE